MSSQEIHRMFGRGPAKQVRAELAAAMVKPIASRLV